MSLVVHRWTGDWTAGLISGLVFAFNAHTLTRLPHLQAQHVEFLPVVVLALDEVLTRIMQQVESMLNVEAGSLLLSDPATGDLVFQIALSDKADQVKTFRIPKGQGIAGEVALTGARWREITAALAILPFGAFTVLALVVACLEDKLVGFTPEDYSLELVSGSGSRFQTSTAKRTFGFDGLRSGS